jgi:hypothetical protein
MVLLDHGAMAVCTRIDYVVYAGSYYSEEGGGTRMVAVSVGFGRRGCRKGGEGGACLLVGSKVPHQQFKSCC